MLLILLLERFGSIPSNKHIHENMFPRVVSCMPRNTSTANRLRRSFSSNGLILNCWIGEEPALDRWIAPSSLSLSLLPPALSLSLSVSLYPLIGSFIDVFIFSHLILIFFLNHTQKFSLYLFQFFL